MIDLSVIIISYHTKKLLKDCLKSVYQQKGIDYQVIVVDNGSSDGSVAMVKQSFPKTKLIKNQKNLGFAAANNQGLAKGQGRYRLLLNSDTVINGSTGRELATMVAWMDRHQEVGISTAQILTPTGYQSIGGYFPTLKRVILWMTFIDDLPWFRQRAYHLSPKLTAGLKPKPGQPPEADWLALDWVTGAFFFLRNEVYQELGGLDEDFFMYVEELEYCWRAKKNGWQVAMVPVLEITHLGGGSSTQNLGPAIIGEYRNLIKLYEKHLPPWQLPLVKLSLKLGALARYLLFGYGRGNREARKIYGQALGLG